MIGHLDFTIDFETCSLSANAAVMQVAVVPWLRDEDEDPFCKPQANTGTWPYEGLSYVGFVDLRTCVVDGFDFDRDTIKWWSERSDVAKMAVTAGHAQPVDVVLVDALKHIHDVSQLYAAKSICLWCQGPDVDIAILRNLCTKYDTDLESQIPHTSYRDCRTVILEAALLEAERSKDGKGTRANGIAMPDQLMRAPSLAYKMFDPLPEAYAEGSEAHDALYDAYMSSWNTWQALRWLRGR
jgi:hypothetical protein